VSASRGRAKRGESASPTYLVWEITLARDLGCKHCGSRAGKARTNELSTEKCLDLVEQFAEAGIREITLIGGEAYLRDDWDTIAGAISNAGIRCGITTGARNLTQERVDRAVAAGVHTIGISIDGLEQTHDMLRGRAALQRS
jgi:MoaA/NifB/PqqE/SkfB family radical SAM enzyme